MYVCLCRGLTESDVRQVALAGMVAAESLFDAFGLEDEECCGRCAKNIHELVSIATGNFVCSPSDAQPTCADRCHSPA